MTLEQALGLASEDMMFRLRSFEDDPKEIRFHELRQIFSEHSLWFADPDSLNDPLECKPQISFSANGKLTSKQIRLVVENQFAHEKYSKRLELYERLKSSINRPEALTKARIGLSSWFEGMFQGSSVCCFFSKLTLPLWASYGADSTGFCLIFRRNTEWSFEIPSTHFARSGKGIFLAQPIDYVTQYPAIDLDEDWSSNDEAAWIAVRKGLTTKGINWLHEQELRVIRPGVGSSLQRFDLPSLAGVIVGRNISEPSKSRLLDAIAKFGRHLKTFEVNYSPGSYEPTYSELKI